MIDKILSTIESYKDEMISLQKLLTNIPALAPEAGGQGELEKCIALENWLKDHGITNLQRFDAHDDRVKSGIRPNLLATIPGKDSTKSLWIMTHLDVVPEGDISLWNTNPWQVVESEGKLFGRGVEDDQQGLVASIFAALALVKNQIQPNYDVKLLFVADEEVGSKYGISYILNNHNLFNKNDIILVPDGGDSNGETIELSEKNILWLKITTIGKQTHASRPDDGNNAFLANCELALKLNLLETFFDERDDLFEPDRSTFQPTKKDPNVPNINTIPGEDTFYLDSRILPCYTLNCVRKEIKTCIKEIEKKYKVKVSVTELQAEESPATPNDAPVVKLLSEAIKKVYNRNSRIIGIGGGTVAAILRKAGYKAAVWGKLDECAHNPNEYCIIDNLIGDAKVMACMMLL